MPPRVKLDQVRHLLNPADVAATAPKRRGKYNARPTVYRGVRYASKAEADRAQALDWLVSTGNARFWVGQPRFRLGVPENRYVADFLVIGILGGVWVEDVKGHETAKFARDKKLWRAYGPCELRIIRGGVVAEIIHPEPSH